MQIKTHKFFSHKLSLLAPALAFFFSIASIFALIFLTSNNSTFAAPGAGGAPTTVSFALDAMSVDFHFTPAELSASTFKQDNVNASISTNNPTGFTFYVSSIDEDTNLNHTDSSVTTKIASITSPLVESNFTPKSWGYSADGVNFKPIPKASTPDTVLTTTNTTGQRVRVDFGVKASPDLNSGTYSKQVLFTAVTNAAPATATFLPGPQFNNLLANIAPPSSTAPAKHFKKSTTAPANIAMATVVSTADSGRPIYMWYDSADQTIYWWSEADDVFANENSSSMFEYTHGRHSRLDTLDLSGINTINVKNMSRFFFNNGLKSLDLSVLDTRNVENMSYMFAGFEATILPDLTRLNTGNVKDMSHMFSNAHFPSLDLRHFDTHNVETMYRMFSQAGATSINLSGWDVRKNRNVFMMFWDNRTVKTIDMSGWKNDSLELMDDLFSDLPALESINLTGFTTNNVRSFDRTFSKLPSLTSLDLSSFDTSNVEQMRNMFDGASGLTSLDVSNFNTSKVFTMEYMFRGLKVSSLDLHNF
ncbi:BspA family leucine-rich repeat surface protein, partial [Candidatus Saccharibacteria bacterium]|nr:BspA family leucine-rich repeat surface protein [Candidatus Saccharibacteria bacterium]